MNFAHVRHCHLLCRPLRLIVKRVPYEVQLLCPIPLYLSVNPPRYDLSYPRRSSLKFMRLASGDADIYPRFAPCSEWDTCAPHAILRAAGGEIFRWEGAGMGGPVEPLAYNKPSLLSPFFVATGRLADGEEKCPPPTPLTP